MIASIARSWRLPTLSPYPDLCFVVLTEQGSGGPQRGTVNSFRSWAKKDRTVVPPAHRRFFFPPRPHNTADFFERERTHTKSTMAETIGFIGLGGFVVAEFNRRLRIFLALVSSPHAKMAVITHVVAMQSGLDDPRERQDACLLPLASALLLLLLLLL